MHTTLCQEKAALVAEAQALRLQHEGKDGLHNHNLSLQSELLSLRGQHAKMQAELRAVEHASEHGNGSRRDVMVAQCATTVPWR